MESNHCFTLCKQGEIVELFVLIFCIFKALNILYPQAKGINIRSKNFLLSLVLPEKFLQP